MRHHGIISESELSFFRIPRHNVERVGDYTTLQYDEEIVLIAGDINNISDKIVLAEFCKIKYAPFWSIKTKVLPLLN